MLLGYRRTMTYTPVHNRCGSAAHSQIRTSRSTTKSSTFKDFSPMLFCDFICNFGPDAKLIYVKRNTRQKFFIQPRNKFRYLSTPAEELLRSEEPVYLTQWYNSVVKLGKRKLFTPQTTKVRSTFKSGSDTRGKEKEIF